MKILFLALKIAIFPITLFIKFCIFCLLNGDSYQAKKEKADKDYYQDKKDYAMRSGKYANDKRWYDE